MLTTRPEKQARRDPGSINLTTPPTRQSIICYGVLAAVHFYFGSVARRHPSNYANVPTCALSEASTNDTTNMYGLIGRITAKPGKRDALVAILLEGIKDMPGCLSYIVAEDPTDQDAIWVTETWDNKDSHQASLSLPSVQEAMAKGRPLIARFDEQTETEPVGGHGLVPSEK